MEIKQLEYFRAIVEAGTISGAARELHMTQPPLSYQIKMMEEELKVSLFLRGTKRITLTEAGKTLYEQAEKILTLTELTKSEVLKSSQATTLHIGMTPSTVSMMSNYLQQFARRYPQIRFDIHEGSTFTLKEQLENTRVQLENAKAEVQKPFPQEEELKTKSARLNELNAMLNLDKRENEIVDGERGEEEPQKSSADRER